jgi:hypothetical protein
MSWMIFSFHILLEDRQCLVVVVAAAAAAAAAVLFFDSN